MRASRPACSDAEPALVGVDAVGLNCSTGPADMVPGMGPSFPAGFLFLALEDLFLLMEQVNTKSQAPGRINDENVNHTPTRKTGVSPTLDLRHTFLYLTPFPRRLPMLGRDERHGRRMFGGSARKYAQM